MPTVVSSHILAFDMFGHLSSTTMVHQLQLKFGELQDTVYAKMVQKVGTRRFWEDWAKDVADIIQSRLSIYVNENS